MLDSRKEEKAVEVLMENKAARYGEDITPEVESMNRFLARQMRIMAEVPAECNPGTLTPPAREADGPHVEQHFRKLRSWDKITSTTEGGLGHIQGRNRRMLS